MVATDCARRKQQTVSGARRGARVGFLRLPHRTDRLAANALSAEVSLPLNRRDAVGAFESLILKHSGFVRRIAYHYVRRLPSHIEVDDLIQAGMVGLLEAARRYGPHASASFETFAGSRVRGAMMDYLRTTDWRPRLLLRRIREIEAATHRIRSQTGKIPTPGDVAAALGISLEGFHRTMQDAASSKLMSLDHLGPEDAGRQGNAAVDELADPAHGVEQKELEHAVAAAIESLPENERTVLLLYYDGGRLLHEIGDELDLCESRVCQIRKRAVERVRTIVERWLTPRRVAGDPASDARA